MNVLITGVAGLLGSRLADWIIENKPELTLLELIIFRADILIMLTLKSFFTS